MPRVLRNQVAYLKNPAQKTGIGFPIARIVVVISLAPEVDPNIREVKKARK